MSLAQMRSALRAVRIARLAPDNASLRLVARAELAAARMFLDRLERTLHVSIGRRFPSKRESKCSACGGGIAIGEPIAWIPRTSICAACGVRP